MIHVNVRGAEAAVRAAARAGIERLVLTSLGRVARRGARHGRQRGLAAPRLVPVGLRALQARGRGRGARGRRARRRGGRLGQPVLGAGPRPCRRHRPDHDRLPQRPPAGVRRHEHQHRRHPRLRRRAPARRRERRSRASATCSTAATMTSREALEIVSELTGVAEKPRFLPPAVPRPPPRSSRARSASRGKHPPVCRAMVRTMLHGHRYDGSRADARARPHLHARTRHVRAHDRMGAV